VGWRNKQPNRRMGKKEYNNKWINEKYDRK
jgi:hypothetical protein